MELLIVSGLSGAGKSVAMNALEDIGFFCIDNVPAGLLPSITAFSEAGDSQLERVALSMDVRGCRTSEEIERALDKLDEQGVDYKILFLDAPDDVLMRRYSETRRRHPISIAEGISTREACKGTQNIEAFAGACRLRHQYRPTFYSTKQRTHLRSFCKKWWSQGRHAPDRDVLWIQIRHPAGGRPCAGCALPAQPLLRAGTQA